MAFSKAMVLVLATSAIIGAGLAHAQKAVDRFQSLVEVSDRRLAVAEQVALAKWDSGAPIEDSAREQQVIVQAVREGQAMGVDEASVTNFFKAQIEANKLVQYSLFAEWRRSGKVPAHAPINLLTTVRPELDQIQHALVLDLARTAALRRSNTCPSDIAAAITSYVQIHRSDLSESRVIALHRALAGTCSR
jgi:chorismate mutase